MSTSFTHQGDWFVFNSETSATIERGFKSKRQAIAWIVKQRMAGNPLA